MAGTRVLRTNDEVFQAHRYNHGGDHDSDAYYPILSCPGCRRLGQAARDADNAAAARRAVQQYAAWRRGLRRMFLTMGLVSVVMASVLVWLVARHPEVPQNPHFGASFAIASGVLGLLMNRRRWVRRLAIPAGVAVAVALFTVMHQHGR